MQDSKPMDGYQWTDTLMDGYTARPSIRLTLSTPRKTSRKILFCRNIQNRFGEKFKIFPERLSRILILNSRFAKNLDLDSQKILKNNLDIEKFQGRWVGWGAAENSFKPFGAHDF